MALLNSRPIFTGVPKITINRLTTANPVLNIPSSFTGTSQTNFTRAFDSHNTYGSYVQKARLKIVGGSNLVASSTSDTVVKFGIGSNNTIIPATQVSLFEEIYIPLTTLSPTVAGPTFEVQFNLALAPEQSIYVGWTKLPGSSIDITIIGGDYEKKV